MNNEIRFGRKVPKIITDLYKFRYFFRSRYFRLYLIAFSFYYLAWALYNYYVQPDTAMYLQMGRGIFEHLTIGYRGNGGIFYPMAFRMPMAPFFLGFFYFIVRDANLAYFFYSLFQVFLAPILPCVAFYFGSQINKKVGYGSYIFVLFHANVMACFLMILTDIFFAVSSGITFVAFWTALQKKRNRDFLFTGLIAGLSCLTRPIMKLYYLVVALLSLACFSAWKPLFRYFAMFCLGFALIVSPWIIRNFIHYRAFVMETNQGLNMLWTNWQLVKIEETDPPEIRKVKQKILNYGSSPVNILTYRGWQYWLENDYKISKTLQKIAVETYMKHPEDIFHNWRENFLNMTYSQIHFGYIYNNTIKRPFYVKIRNLSIINPADFDRKVFHLYCEIKRLIKWCYMYIAPLGLLLLLWYHRKMGIFIAVHILYFTGLTAFVAGYDRYRLNIEVFYAVLIVYPIIHIITIIIKNLKKLTAKGKCTNGVEHYNSNTE